MTIKNKEIILASQSVATNDRGWVNFSLHKLICILQQLSSYYYLTMTTKLI